LENPTLFRSRHKKKEPQRNNPVRLRVVLSIMN
jgi:hypothetical protein